MSNNKQIAAKESVQGTETAPLTKEKAKQYLSQDITIMLGFLDFIKGDEVLLDRLSDRMINMDKAIRKSKTLSKAIVPNPKK